MKRPLVPVALIYVSGILAADWVTIPLPWLFAAAAAVPALAIFWPRARPILLGAMLGIAGMANQSLRTAALSPHDLRRVVGPNREAVTLHGRLTETPYQRIYETDERQPVRTIAFVEASSILLQGTNWQPAAGRVMVSTPSALPAGIFGGQTVEITGSIALPKTAAAEGLFDYRAYLRRQGIYYQLYAASTNQWRIVSSPVSRPVADRFCAWARATLARGLPEVDEPLRLLWAMTLGWKTGLSGEVAEPFMRSGTMHIFAISGLHIALIALMFVRLLRVFKVPRGICAWLVLPAIWFYTGVTGWQASAIRSTIMSSIIILGWSLERPSDLLNSLAAAGLLILLWDPQQLFQASFQLSFFVVLSLALFIPVFNRVRDQLSRPDPLLPTELLPRWRRWLTPALRFSTAGLITSLAAWIGSMPIIAFYFHLFTPGSLFANIIVVPLSSLALTSNMASLLVGGWFPGAAELFNHSAWFFMWLMIRISQWFAWLRGGCYYVATPSLLSFLLYYAVLLSLLGGWLARPRLRKWTAAGLAALALLWAGEWYSRHSATRLTILPLASGQAVYYDAPAASADCLIDCGDDQAVQFTTQPYLRAQGVNVLPLFFLTHGDARHVNGAAAIRADFSAAQICLSPVRARSITYTELREHFEKTPRLIKFIKTGDRAGPWTVLHPDAKDHFSRADDNSLVLKGEFKGTKVLLMSDLGRPGQNALASRNADLRTDIVVSGLPASDEPLAEGFLDRLEPRLIIISDAPYPARASRKVRERLAHRPVPVLYTRDMGSLTITFDDRGWGVRGMSGTNLVFEARGRQK